MIKKRVPFNALIDPSTKKIIQKAQKVMGVSEGGVVDIWAQFDKATDAIGTPEIKKAAANLRKLMKQARAASTKRKTAAKKR